MPSILVADGDLAIAHTVRRGFQEMEVTVFSTQTGAKAFELFVRYRPDIVLLDMELPDRSGMEVLAEIHQHDAGIPVILMSAHATANMAIEAIARAPSITSRSLCICPRCGSWCYTRSRRANFSACRGTPRRRRGPKRPPSTCWWVIARPCRKSIRPLAAWRPRRSTC